MAEEILEVSLDRGELALPPLAAGERLRSARLTLLTPGTIRLPLRINRQPDSGDVSWISGEWGQLRSIVAVTVTPQSAKIAALKVSAGGVWFTPVPPGSIDPGSFQPACRFSLQSRNPLRFPPLTATGLLLEIVSEQKVTDKPSIWNPDVAPITGLEIDALNELVDLSVGLDDDAPFFSFKGRKNDTVVLDLLPELTRKPDAKKLRVRAAGPVQIRATLERSTLRDAPPPSTPPKAALTFPSSGQGEAVASWSIDAPKPLAAVSATVWREALGEKLAISPAKPPDIRLAQLVDLQHGAAQRVGPVEGLATFAELWLGARAGPASGTLALHADQDGRPGAALGSAPWRLAAGEARWVSAPVGRPMPGPLWLVLSGVEGEAYCGLWSDGAPAALGRVGAGPWMKAAGMAWHRVRVEAPPPPKVKVIVARDTQRVELETEGPFALDSAAIGQLNLASGAITVEVRSEAAGTVELQGLRISMEP